MVAGRGTRGCRHIWRHGRCVRVTAEDVQVDGPQPPDHPRSVIANLRHTSRFIYERVAWADGDSENRVTGLHDRLQIGRMGCCRFRVTQVRVLLTTAAVLLVRGLHL